MKNSVSWKTFFLLISLSLLSVVCVIPYIITVQGETLQTIGYSYEIIFVAQFIQSFILFSVAIFFGLYFAKKTDFHLPFIEAILERKDYKKVLDTFLIKSIVIGIVVAMCIYLLDSLFISLGIAISTHEIYAAAWQTLLAAFYGGIAEEVIMRLFLMTFLVWSAMKIFKVAQPTPAVVIASIIITAIVFGLGHLPITATLTTITPLVILRAVVLNSIGGIVFGWLFWRKGLESAMIAHFTTDIVLLTILPQFIYLLVD